MRRRRVSAAVPAATAMLLSAILLSACGGSHPRSRTAPSTSGPGSSVPGNTVPSSSAPLTVSPAHPTTTDPIGFSFTAPVATGVQGKFRISYSVSITGPSGNGCSGAREATVAQVGKGGTASVTVGPHELGAPWCPGAYTARAFELQSAACTGSAPCPQFIRVVGIVARASFSVTGS